MIAARTGEIDFEDGLRITAHVLIGQLRLRLPVEKVSVCELPIKGWRKYELGEHTSDFGVFTVEAVTSSELRVEGVFLSHSHSFYESATKDDSERRRFTTASSPPIFLASASFLGTCFLPIGPRVESRLAGRDLQSVRERAAASTRGISRFVRARTNLLSMNRIGVLQW
jgi:hypothetical protein